MLFNNAIKTVYSQNESVKKGGPLIIVLINEFNLIIKKLSFHNINVYHQYALKILRKYLKD